MDLLNKIMVIGNLTRDPEVRELGEGKTVANLSLAIDQGGGSRDKGTPDPSAEPVFLDVVVWDRMAENAAQFLKKGSAVLIEGRLRMDSWQDKDTGKTRRKLKVAGERMRFLNLGGNRDNPPAREQRSQFDPSRRREPAGNRR